ncbi:NAD-dependent epimerase/dehydratase family protein [Rummeliibacillus pycnus]|uniref:NAD-dependent epimerase/dehydratase family protein n=1 Tax=Rummeliibacillus pycnus TaxID=101070 RepID=UPI0014765C17|nr:NAD-dependent epimerase/dehydratase family protein [Rummeliibacillus pycnus]
MDVLLFGGSEFVGRAYLERLVADGHMVDIVTRGIKPITVKGYRNHLKCNRQDENALATQLEGRAYDYVFDISAYTVEDIKPILKVLNRTKLQRYFLMSTGGVYTPSDSVVNEDGEIGFNKNWGTYGVDKRKIELELMEVHRLKNFPILIFRPTYIYGEGNNLYRETYFFQRLIDQLPIPYPDTSKGKAQYIHIEDLVNITMEAIVKEATNGEAFNITNSEIFTWKELIQTFKLVTNKEVPEISITQTEMDQLAINSREFFPFRDVTYLLDIQKLIDFGLSTPTISLKEGLERSYNWFKSKKIPRQYHLLNSLEKVVSLKMK